MEGKIIIGLGFGDEGKGITTDYLCSQYPDGSIVVRFSGGQQAGHTVIHNGIKHVHSNFGSGTLRNIPSYFSEHCTVYPNTIKKERSVLLSKGIDPIG
jgi:adenylosuccinate synthase